jgi:L-ascorbate metabolism protein UlaG (beta-lactamase superfamily)
MVTKHGAVLLGNHVACDAHDDRRPLRVVTHAHADHLAGLRTSVKKCDRVLMTKATRDLIEIIEGPDAVAGDNVKTVDYGKATRYGDEQVTLLYSLLKPLTVTHRAGVLLGLMCVRFWCPWLNGNSKRARSTFSGTTASCRK